MADTASIMHQAVAGELIQADVPYYKTMYVASSTHGTHHKWRDAKEDLRVRSTLDLLETFALKARPWLPEEIYDCTYNHITSGLISGLSVQRYNWLIR